MNKHIYYDDKKISVGSDTGETAQNQVLVNYENGNSETLKVAIKDFLKQGNKKSLFVQTNSVSSVFEELKKGFYFIEAAGGLIQNKDKYLFIKRLGKWDLPKGKLDKGETIQQAAIRECEEECAVTGLTILKQLPDTYHIYEYKTGHALKVSYWFHMETSSNKELKPQTEENIEEVRWLSVDEIKSIVLKNTYITIEKLVRSFFKI
ncbi:MAG: NUDIX domain-containing protein [Bacteroidia bacterium]|nr:NUDIX domain-containing protein [Sphingobacteriaceae bacterium]MBP9068489.1 NUDIX domain-containing protein [Bacteroidia bacterium]